MILVINDDYTIEPVGALSANEKGTDETVAAMWGVAQVAARSAEVKSIAKQLENDPQRLYDWLVAHVRFAPDPSGVEYLTTPQSMIRTIRRQEWVFGDCKKNSLLGVSILGAMGRVPAFITLNKKRTPQRKYQHILFGYRATPISAKQRRTLPDPSGGSFGIHAMDPQERRPIGHIPPEPVRRVYVATGPHAVS